MQITLDNISKRYASGWVIKDLSKTIKSGGKLSITGLNGTGKSTLIQMISGYLSPSKGKIIYENNNSVISRNDVYQHLSIVTAYSELDEELSATEIFLHYLKFKPLKIKDEQSFLALVDLQRDGSKPIKDFSSGMKQRLQLGLGVIADVPLLILDEPSSFLDDTKKEWLHNTISEFASEKTIIVASNDPDDFRYCDDHLAL